jgi:deoxycytidylate deaminase
MAAIAKSAAVLAAIRTDCIARTPPTIVVAIGLIISTGVTDANAAVDTDAFHGATRQRRRAQQAHTHLHPPA